jgi:GNAT superfamily N-acetyltransferase
MLINQIKTRDADARDVDVLARLISELGYPTTSIEMLQRLEPILSNNTFKTIICELDGVVVGMAGGYRSSYYEKNGSYVRITALVTSEAYRKNGVGETLVLAFESWGKTIGANALILNCGNRPERDAAHKFYKKIGFSARSTGYVKLLS